MPVVQPARVAVFAVTFGLETHLLPALIALAMTASAMREKARMLNVKFIQISVCALLCVALLARTTRAEGDWQPKDGPEGMPQFIVPPGEDPSAYSPAHWGLTDKSTRPAPIPAIEQPRTGEVLPGPRPDYQHLTSFGEYEPKFPKEQKRGGKRLSVASQPEWHQPPSQDPASVLYPTENATSDSYFDELGGMLTDSGETFSNEVVYAPSYDTPPALPGYSGQYAGAPAPPRSSMLRMTEAQSAYQPSPYHVKPPEPTFGEIIKTGAAFISFEQLFLEPHFQGNSAITTDSATRGSSRDYNYGFMDASKITLGFESSKGPAFKLTYWELSDGSDIQTANPGAAQTATTSIFLSGPRRNSELTANGPGERITARHNIWIKNTSAIFFKEIKMPVSRLNGMMGFRYVNIHQTMHSEILDSSNVNQGTLHGTHYFRGIGPTIGLEYFRPIGHTHIEFIGGATTTLVYGRRDQIAYNTAAADFTRFGTDELISGFDAKLGAQWVREWGRRYRIFARGTIVAQSWFGGGTASDPTGDFGLFGLGFAAGLNH